MEDKFTIEELHGMLQKMSARVEGFAEGLVMGIGDENLSMILRQQAAGEFLTYMRQVNQVARDDFDEYISPETIRLAYQNMAQEKIMATYLAGFVDFLDRSGYLHHLPDGAMRSYDEVMTNAFGPKKPSPIHGELRYRVI